MCHIRIHLLHMWPRHLTRMVHAHRKVLLILRHILLLLNWHISRDRHHHLMVMCIHLVLLMSKLIIILSKMASSFINLIWLSGNWPLPCKWHSGGYRVLFLQLFIDTAIYWFHVVALAHAWHHAWLHLPWEKRRWYRTGSGKALLIETRCSHMWIVAHACHALLSFKHLFSKIYLIRVLRWIFGNNVALALSQLIITGLLKSRLFLLLVLVIIVVWLCIRFLHLYFWCFSFWII